MDDSAWGGTSVAEREQRAQAYDAFGTWRHYCRRCWVLTRRTVDRYMGEHHPDCLAYLAQACEEAARG